MERQSTSKLYRALIAVVAFFVLCTSAILFASCGTNPLECEHTYGPGDVKEVRVATCGENGTVTYECSKCGALVTVTGTLATGEHTIKNGRCTVCGATGTEGELTLADLKADLTSILNALNNVAGKDDVDKVAQSVVDLLKNPDQTIPTIWELLTDIRDNVAAFDFGDIELMADGSDEPTTLGAVIASLYKQVNELYLSYFGDSKKDTTGLYDMLVGGTGKDAHVHNWVLELKPGTKYSCTTPNTYVWGCSFCDATKGGNVEVMATGHATEFVTGKTAEGHHYDATCISPARVEGYCHNCGEWTGEWTTQGQPTYQHHYVLETQRVIPGEDGNCTAVHQNVYHCETCGGAYVEETKSSSQHNYYYVANEDGTNKQPMKDEDKIAVWNKAHPDGKQITDLSQLTVSEEQELNELLKEGRLEDGRVYALNIVYYSEPNCVDPALIVVECMECGVRYAYTFGQPDGHHFILVHDEVAATCTMDGLKPYFYCDHCGYFFFLDGIKDDVLVEISTGDFAGHKEFKADANLGSKEYTRNYMTDLDGKVINDKTNKALENQDAYDVASKEKNALGHDYVVVYTNNRKCVTAQDYILVCKRDGCLVKGKTFDELVQVKNEAAADYQLFYQEVNNGPYFLKRLTGDNTKSVLDALLATVHETADDTADTTSDLTKEWEAIKDGERADVFIWLAKHGYLVRDSLDDEVFGSISREDAKKWYDAETGKLTDGAKTAIDEYLAKLDALQQEGEYDLAKLYNGYSKAETGTTTKTKVASNVLVGFELPVTGHAFNDYFVTVVGGCTLYERHVRFCAVCGQYTATPSETTGVWPYIVSGDTDASLLKGGDNDLKTSWDAVCAAADADAMNGQDMLIRWLLVHGYLNDYRLPLTEDDVTDPDARLAQETNILGERLKSWLGDAFTLEWLKSKFTGKNVLDEFKVTKTLGQQDMHDDDPTDPYFMPQDTDIELGHTFDAVALLSEEVCDAPGRYVYVCSKCGDTLNTSKGTLEYKSGSATVDTGLKLVENPIFKFEEYILNASAQKARLNDQTTTDKLDKSDLQGLYEDVENVGDKKFDWLIKMGYLNNVIDTYYTVGYTDAQKVLHGGWLADNIKKAGDNTENIEASIQGWYDDARGYFYDENGALKEAAVTEHKDYLKALALELLGKDGKITDYYEKSSNTYRTDPEKPETAVTDVPANKTIDNAATEVPMSGHLYAYESGDRINLSENGDGICTDFRSKEVLEKYYAAHVMIHWVDPAIVDGAFKANPDYDKDNVDVKKWAPYATADGEPAGWVVLTDKEGTPVEFDPADLDPNFVQQVTDFGIVGACMRENCPYHTKYDKDKHAYDGVEKGDAEGIKDFTAGYLAATDHVKVYEKYAVDKNTNLPIESRVDTIGDKKEKVYYNYKKVEEYMVVESAKYFAEGVGGTGTNYERWTAIASKAGLDKTDETRTDPTEKANYEILYNAAKAARNDDLHNLYTLQWIWNTLFVPADWLNPEDEDLAETRQTMYPTLPIKDAEGKPLTTMREQVLRLQTLFQEAGVHPLWREIEGHEGEYVSAWRPLTDSFMPSCWVSLRCKWYRSTQDHKCTYIDPTVNHDWPYYGEFDYDTHAANCKHPDLCNTCGKEMGRFGDHKLIQVDPGEDNELNSQSMKAAWIEVLKHYKDIDWLKDIIVVDETKLNDEKLSLDKKWSTCWRILKDTCYEGKTVDGVKNVGKEDGHAIYICTGELEVIYNEIVNPIEQDAQTWEQVVGEGLDVEWDLASAADAKDGNYFVATIDNEKHNFVTRYYALRDFKLNGVEYKKDQLLAANEDEWNEKFAFSEFVCQGGYYTLDVCTHIKRDTAHVAEGEGACKPGCEHECGKVEEGSRRDYPAAGHYLAPVENYWTYAERYTPASAEHNASMIQVCVICGVRTQSREYGVTDDGQDHEQYNIATKTMIDRWNEHVEAYNKKVDESLGDLEEGEDPVYLYKAQLPLSKDLKGTSHDSTVEAGANIFGKGLNAYKESAKITVNGNGIAGEAGGEANVLVAEGKTLTFEAGVDAENPGVQFKGTVTFVGEGEGATVDFSAVGGMLQAQRDVDLVFENMTVIISDSETSSDNNRLALRSINNTLTFKNSTILSEKTPIAFNSGDLCRDNKIIIEDSVFVSKTSVGFALWNKRVSVEATRSVFFGAWAGAFIRGGNATFEDCEFYTTAGQKDTSWSEGAQSDVSAAIIIGNKTEALAYGDAEVVLHGCKFGLTTADNMTKWGQEDFTPVTACTSADPAIAAFSSTVNHTTVTLDGTTTANANEINWATENVVDTSGKKTLIHNTVLTAEEAADTKVLKGLFTSLGANGGELALPKDLEAPVEIKDQLTVAKDVTIDLNGKTLDAKKGISVDDGASLTIKGGEVKGAPGTEEGYTNQLFTVREGTLDLEGVTVTLTGAKNLSADGKTFDSTYGIAAGSKSNITVANSVINNPYGPAIGSNANNADSAEIVLTDSAFISDFAEKDNNSTSVGLLLNNKSLKLYAGGCYFYGVNAAAWLRSGEAHFYGCTFASPATARSYNTGFSSGAGFHKDVTAVLVVGNGNNPTAYGAVNVEIVDCNVKAATANGALPTAPAKVATTALAPEEVKALSDKYGTDYDGTWFESHASGAATQGKPMTLVATDKTIGTTVSFSDEDTAKAFIPNFTLTKGTNVFMYGTADRSSFHLSYKDAKGQDVAISGIDEVIAKGDKDVVEAAAQSAITDAVRNGGTITLPKQDEGKVAKVTIDSQLAVAAESSVEIDLNGNNLDWTQKTSSNTVAGDLKISGGTVTVPAITPTEEASNPAAISIIGEGAKLTLENATLVSGSPILPSKGAELVIEKSFIRSNSSTAISTNNILVEPHVTITINDSTIASMDQTDGVHAGNGGNIGLLVNNENVTVNATDSTFYGVVTGAWVRGGEATFEGCTFISGSAKLSGTDWGNGTVKPQDAIAALIVGNGGASEAYGSTKVTLTSCSCIISKEIVKSEDGKYVVDTNNLVTVNEEGTSGAKITAQAYDGTTGDQFSAKKLVLAAFKASTTTITLDATSATSFGVSGDDAFVKDTNVFFGKETTEAKISVTIGSKTTEFTPGE